MPLDAVFQIESGMTSVVPKAGRMMRRDQEFRATSKFSKWPNQGQQLLALYMVNH